MKRCPSCKSTQTERTHRTALQRFISKFGLHPFVCNECGHRFYARNPAPADPNARPEARHP